MIQAEVIENERKIHYYVYLLEYNTNPYENCLGKFTDEEKAKLFIRVCRKKFLFKKFMLVMFVKVPTLEDMMWNKNNPIVLKIYKPFDIVI